MECIEEDWRKLSLDAKNCETNSGTPVESFLTERSHNDYNSAILDLSRKNVARIHVDYVKDEALITTLNLSWNPGISLKPMLGKFVNVVKLYLAHCSLESVPDEIFNLKKLELLDISHNPAVQTLSAEVLPVSLKNLRAVYCGLTRLQNVENLCQLNELNLSDNSELCELPCSIGSLIRLRRLLVARCRIRSLPAEFKELFNLEELLLDGNITLQSLNPALAHLQRLRKLDISRCSIALIPDWLSDLETLEELLLDGNITLQSLNPALARLQRLRMLDISRCSIALIPDWLGDLKMLEELILFGNTALRSLSSTLDHLNRLAKLDVSMCSLTTIPDGMGSLEMLEELLLAGNKDLCSLNPNLVRLRLLKKLDVSQCSLAGVPEWLGDLEMLEELVLAGNKDLCSINPNLVRLRQLKKLDVSQCSLAVIPDSLGDLEMLEELLLAGNKDLCSLNPNLVRLRLLKTLDVSQCSLAVIPEWLGDLEMLIELDLSNNQLQDYPVCTIRLKSLRRLDLSNDHSCSVDCEETESTHPKGNRIKELPLVLSFSNLLELKLSGNPIKEPPEAVWTQGIQAIKSFMRAVLPGGALVLDDSINIVGDTCAGKTTVAWSLVAQSPRLAADGDHTRLKQQLRMSIGESSSQSVIINDFGGSEVCHSLMPAVLPTSGLFIVVFDMTCEAREQSVKKWLLTVLAKSRDVRVIVVGTRADKLAAEKVLSLEQRMIAWSSSVWRAAAAEVDTQIIHLENRQQNKSVEEKLKQLRDCRSTLRSASIRFVTLSCARSDGGIARLIELVVNALRPPAQVPIRWCKFINEMLGQDTCFLTLEHVDSIAKAYFIDERECEIVLRYLAETSQILWFYGHPRLRHVMFPSLQKVIDTCKKILHPDHANQFFGFLCKRDLDRFEIGLLSEPLLRELVSKHEEPWNRSQEHAVPSSKNFEVFVDFMLQFNIISCFTTHEGRRIFVVPSKLQLDVPSSFQNYTQMGENCDNRVTIHLSFLSSVVPVSFFETSLSSMLTVAFEFAHRIVEPWQKGLILVSGGVYFLAILRNNVITLTAFSKSPAASPWTVLRRILTRLNDNAAMSWHGAQPHCAIECPSCARDCQSDDPKSTVDMIEVDLRTLAACETRNDLRLTCSYCGNAIPNSLCFPATACEQKEPKNTASEISRKRKTVQAPERKCPKSTEDKTSHKRKNTQNTDILPVGDCSNAVNRLRSKISRLSEDLAETSVLIIAIDLYTATTPSGSGIITVQEMERIKRKTASREMALELLNAVCRRGDAAVEQLILSLRSDRVARPDLADLLQTPSSASEQGHADLVAHQ